MVSVLQTVTDVLQRSHRARCLYHKSTVRGFELLVALVDSLADSLNSGAVPLSPNTQSPALALGSSASARLNWRLVEPKHILCLLQQLFALLLAAIRFEAGNAHLFSTQVGFHAASSARCANSAASSPLRSNSNPLSPKRHLRN